MPNAAAYGKGILFPLRSRSEKDEYINDGANKEWLGLDDQSVEGTFVSFDGFTDTDSHRW